VCVGQRTHTTHTHAPLHTEDVTVNLGERRVCGGSCVRRHDACHPHPHAPLSVCLSVCLSVLCQSVSQLHTKLSIYLGVHIRENRPL